jgi:predicted PurR-regulated permease PerM
MSTTTELPGEASSSEVSLGLPISVKTFSALIAILAVVAFLRYAAAVFIPIVLAVLVGYALDPLVSQLVRWRIPRPLGAMLAVLAVLAGAGSSAYALRHRFVAVIESLPDNARKLRKVIENQVDTPDSPGTLDRIKEAAKEIENTANATATPSAPKAGITRVQVEPPVFRASEYIWLGSRSLVDLAGQAIVILFLAFFLLASGDLYKRKLVRIVGGDFAKKRITVEAIHEIDRQIERFLAVQIWTSVFVGVATFLVLELMGVSQPAIWAVAAGVLNFIPYFGAVIAAVGLGMVAFVQFGTLGPSLAVAALVLFIRVIEGGLLSPMWMGKAAGINGAALFVSLLFWTWMWGLIGTLVAVPLMMIIKTACERIEGLEAFGELLNEK